MIVTGKAMLAGVMGWPVGHSRSPRLHGWWLQNYGIDGAYVPLAVPPERLKAAIAGLPAMGFKGANVTIPHKEAVLPFLASLDAAAEAIGAVNTLIVDETGAVHGRNTDVYGFAAQLDDAAPDWATATRAALVLGAGGAARGAIFALGETGSIGEIRIANRTPERAKALIASLAPHVKSTLVAVDWKDLKSALKGADLLVNTTSLGMVGHPPLPLAAGDLHGGMIVYDLVYVPLETALLRAAHQAGARTVEGLGMLIHQARPGFHAWFGIDPEPSPTLLALLKADINGTKV
ncbi:MAG: shikimate dehydrogenase [Alphaproteobacteria bacterium]|nr:shikimate dehydrogenase [Alphaproteobacteria bacterium]